MKDEITQSQIAQLLDRHLSTISRELACNTGLKGRRPKQAIVTLVECKSGYALITKVSNKTPELVSGAIIDTLGCMVPLFKTSTFDNDKEFAEYPGIDKVFC